MPDFMFVYHGGGRPESEEAQKETMARWGAWMEKNQSSLVNPGNPVGMSKTVTANGVEDNGGPNPTSGFTIVKADSIDAAVDIAKSNPILADGGTVEVAELYNIEM